MDWSGLGSKIASSGAKMLGDAIPLPGAGMVADMAAEALGTEKDPDAMAKAIDQDPEAVRKLKEVESQHKEEMRQMALNAEVEKISQVNKTMRDNNAPWRRAWGWISALSFGALILGVCMLAYLGVVRQNTEALTMIPQLISAATTLFAVPMAVLGVAEYQGGKERRAAAGDKGNGGLAGLIREFKGGGK